MTASLLDKLRFNKLTTAAVDTFESENFTIKFPPNWRQVRKLKNFSIVDFINLEDDTGLIQLSSYSHEDPNYVYDIENARLELEKEGFKPEKRTLSNNEALIYAVKFKAEKTVQYRFEIGSGRYRLFATLTFEDTDDITKDKYFDTVTDVLSTLEFKK